MSTTGLHTFDRTIETTNIWLNEVMDAMGGMPDRQRAYHALRAVLHVIRDRLPPQQVAHLGAQLPILVRGVFFDGWTYRHHPTDIKTREEFMEEVASELRTAPDLPIPLAVKAVLTVLEQHVTRGEMDKVRGDLPKDLQRLWDDVLPAEGELAPEMSPQ